MANTIPENSVGIVAPHVLKVNEPLRLVEGRTLESYEIIYETYGELNAEKSNAVLICHALSGDHHVAGYHSENDEKPGWWDVAVGPGKIIDTNKFFVVCCNNIGGCAGSTGPSSINPETGEAYGADFPLITVKDWVKSQAKLTDHLGIDQYLAVVGGSLGGMTALQWAVDYPERQKHSVVIAAAPKLTPQNIAFNEMARQAIMSDPEFHGGHYYRHNTRPEKGVMLARMLGHITYLSDDSLWKKFGRDLRGGKINYNYEAEFEVESYLRYQGQKFARSFDANTYLLITRVLDYFDPATEYDDDLTKALARVQSNFLVVSFSSDWRFAPSRSHEIVRALLDNDKDVSYAEIETQHGHDSFLLDIPEYTAIFRAYMQRVAKEAGL